MINEQLNILGDNIGQIKLIGYLGGDLANVNGARASFGVEHAVFEERDAKLLHRLGRDKHETPLRHTYFQFHIKAPEFVARQWYKHIVGCEYAFKDLPWSEFSQRYKEVKPEFYSPKGWRTQSTENKQASAGSLDDDTQLIATEWLENHYLESYELYRDFLRMGIAREQARMVLPLAIYTEWTWTASLQAVVHFCALRNHPGAQGEIQAYAHALEELVRPIAPHSWLALMNNHPINLMTHDKV